MTFGSTDAVPAEVSERAGELDAARATRDYARADAIRAELQDAGWIVETTATGTTVASLSGPFQALCQRVRAVGGTR